MVFVGYNTNSNAYRVADKDFKIYISRDVEFTGKVDGLKNCKNNLDLNNDFEVIFKIQDEKNAIDKGDDEFHETLDFNESLSSDDSHTDVNKGESGVSDLRRSQIKTKGNIPQR